MKILPVLTALFCTGLALAVLPPAASAEVVVRQLASPIPDLAAHLTPPTAAKLDVPGEFLVLPAYEVEANNPLGETTLFAIRNVTVEAQDVVMTFLAPDGTQLHQMMETLEARQTRTVNVRDVPGLPADGQGVKRGFVQIVVEDEVSDPQPAPILVGDYFQVVPGEDFAQGDRLLNFTGGADPQDACLVFDVRFLNGGLFDGGTELTFFVSAPQGSDPNEDPPTIVGNVYNEAGALLGSLQIFTNENSFKLDASALTGAAFGTFEIGFNNTFGHVAADYDASGRFSIGMNGACTVPLMPVSSAQ